MRFDFDSLSEDKRYKLMLATVLPRPIAWVTSQDKDGLVNAAPFPFSMRSARSLPPWEWRGPEFTDTAQGYLPQHPRDRGVRRQFGSASAVEKIRASSMRLPPHVNEVAAVGLTAAPSEKVALPRINESPVAFECKFMREIRLGGLA